MNVNALQYLRDKLLPRPQKKGMSDEQDMAVYRRLKRAENAVYEARDSMNRLLASQEQTGAEHARLTKICDEFEQRVAIAGDTPHSDDSLHQLQDAINRRDDLARRITEIRQEIAGLKNDVLRLESEYQHAQIQVRTSFYKEIPGRHTDGDMPVGQPAQ